MWTAPEVNAYDEPFLGSERDSLDGFLERQRIELLRRCAGLTGPQLAQQSAEPSDLSLLGLLRHLIDVERTWFRIRVAGEDVQQSFADPLGPADPDRAEEIYAELLREWESVRAAVAGVPLDQTFRHRTYGAMSLRWLYLHLIREYAGHIGHADLLRERIDGRRHD